MYLYSQPNRKYTEIRKSRMKEPGKMVFQHDGFCTWNSQIALVLLLYLGLSLSSIFWIVFPFYCSPLSLFCGPLLLLFPLFTSFTPPTWLLCLFLLMCHPYPKEWCGPLVPHFQLILPFFFTLCDDVTATNFWCPML